MPDVERTLSIVKPDAVAAGATGDILSRFEKAGLTIIALKKMQLSEAQAQGFYAVHKERPFFGDLVKFMTEGPIVKRNNQKLPASCQLLVGYGNPLESVLPHRGARQKTHELRTSGLDRGHSISECGDVPPQ